MCNAHCVSQITVSLFLSFSQPFSGVIGFPPKHLLPRCIPRSQLTGGDRYIFKLDSGRGGRLAEQERELHHPQRGQREAQVKTSQSLYYTSSRSHEFTQKGKLMMLKYKRDETARYANICLKDSKLDFALSRNHLTWSDINVPRTGTQAWWGGTFWGLEREAELFRHCTPPWKESVGGRGRTARSFPSRRGWRRRGRRDSRSLSADFRLIIMWSKKLNLLRRELATSSALVALILDPMGGPESRWRWEISREICFES